MKFNLLAATAAVLILATPAVAQNSGGTGGSGTGATTGTGSGSTGSGDTSTTIIPNQDSSATGTSAGTTTGTDSNAATGADAQTGTTTGQTDTGTNTGTNAQIDTTTGQTGTSTNTGTNAQTDTTTGTTADSTTDTATTAATGGQTTGAADPQILQQMSQVTAASDFVTFAAMSDLFEIQSGEFATENVKGKMAKQLSQRIVKDHTKSSREMMDLVKTANLTVQMPTQLDERHQQMLDALKTAAEEPGATTSSTTAAASSTTTSSSTGTEAASGDGVVGTEGNLTVDQIFARQQVQAHEEGVALFRAYSQNGDNPELKQFAEKGLPSLEEHLKMAQDLVKAQDELLQKQQSQTQQ